MHRGLLLFLAGALLATPVAAQTVRGRVIENETGAPIPFTAITLLRADGSTERQVLADSVGGFAIVAAASGSYRLRADRIGYTTTTTDPLLLRALEGVQVEVRLQARVVPLEPLVITARNRSLERGRDGFARRQARGKGYFLTPDSLAARKPGFPTDAFHRIPKILVTWGPAGTGIRSMAGWGCFSVMVDRQIRPLAFSQSASNVVPTRPRSRRVGGLNIAQRVGTLGGGANALDQQLAAEDIRAIEIYADAKDIPKELVSAMNWEAFWPVGSLGRCGVAIVWTNLAW
jgi:carboxypeptidase family protein